MLFDVNIVKQPSASVNPVINQGLMLKLSIELITGWVDKEEKHLCIYVIRKDSGLIVSFKTH